MSSLDILGVGAVTPLGLSAASTCAAFRAGIKALQYVYHPTFPAEPIVGGRVPGSVRLRRTRTDWLINLATRALADCVAGFGLPKRTALFLSLPEVARLHPDLPVDYAPRILREIQRRLGITFHKAEATCDGSAGVLAAVVRGRELVTSGAVDVCCVGGVDSLVNAHDILRLQAASRLKDEDHPMGVMPSEAAAFIIVGQARADVVPLARVSGVGVARTNGDEARTDGLREAFEAALKDGNLDESNVAFLVTDFTGERRHAFDYTFAEMRTFRTIRSSMPRWTFAEAAGHTSAAAGAVGIVLTAVAHAKGYAPGAIGICVASSETNMHASCIVQACTDRNHPPTRPGR